jgi:hypothetical protein
VSDFEVRGAEQFLRLSKALKDAGQGDIRKALHKGLRDTVNREKQDAADALAAALPSGMAGLGKGVKQAIVVKTGADPGVSVVVRFGKAGRGLGAKNAQAVNRKGQFRRPVYKTGAWADQPAKSSGWFDKTWMDKAPALRNGLERVLEDVADDIVRKAR